jgi:DNA polymerase elongation subunit (family B)
MTSFLYETISSVKSRDWFIDRDEFEKCQDIIRKREPLLFLPVYVIEKQIQDRQYEKAKYKIVLNGITTDGNKYNVVLNNIQPYFEIKTPFLDRNGCIDCKPDQACEECVIEKEKENKYISELRLLLKGRSNTVPSKTSIVLSKTFKFYQERRSKCVRFYFDSTYNRKEAIVLVREAGYETLTDDLTNYNNVVCRDYLTSLSTWTIIENYDVINVPSLKGSTITVDIKNFKSYEGHMTDSLLKEKTIVMSWDIETWSPDGSVPSYEDSTHKLFCIGISFNWAMSKTPFLKYCICDMPCNMSSDPTMITIICKSEEEIIRCFGTITQKMQPDFILGFNDSSYDWPWLINRASKYKGVISYLADCMDRTIPHTKQKEDDIMKKYFRSFDVKLEATMSVNGSVFMLPGYIPVDMRTVLRKIHKEDEQSSLKWFLEKYRLPSKEDMPYKYLFHIYAAFQKLAKCKKIKRITRGNTVDFIFTNIIDSAHEEINEDIVHEQIDEYKVNHLVEKEENRLTLKESENKLPLKESENKLPLKESENKPSNEDDDLKDDSEDDESSTKQDIVKNNYLPLIASIDAGTLTEEEFNQYYPLLKEDMNLINKYCVVDAERCHSLSLISCMIIDNREVAKMAYVTLNDAFYKANGMKVRNLCIAIGQKQPFNIRFSNIITPTVGGKFPGAMVIPPVIGLNISKLSMEERKQKAQLTNQYQEWNDDSVPIDKFKNIIDKYGATVSHDTLQKIEEEEGQQPTYFKDFLTEKIGRPIAGLDFASLYPSLIRVYNFSPEYCVKDSEQAQELAKEGNTLTKVDFDLDGRKRLAYFIWHDNKKEKMGVYPYILDELASLRIKFKNELKEVQKIKESMNIHDESHSNPEYDSICLKYNYFNAKQLALKVFMNTFYGEAGNKNSPFFIVEVAGGVTTHGIKALKRAYEFVIDAGCNVYYGDTDSLYISMPEQTFTSLDKLFYTGKITKPHYWSQLVESSFKAIKQINNDVNDMFLRESKTSYLKMAFEEFLFPVIFITKKNYFGVKHEKSASFEHPEIFSRGIKIKRRGICNVSKIIYTDLMSRCTSPDNLYDLLELVLNKIDFIYTNKWSISDFIQTAIYKPNKKNVALHTFVRRMQDRGIQVQENERFNYVLVKKYPYTYDYRGRKKALAVGDYMEFAETAQKENLDIYLDHYVKKQIISQLARLITYHKSFYVAPMNKTAEEIGIADTKTYAKATVYIDECCKKYYSNYNTFGSAHQKIFKQSNKSLSLQVERRDLLISKILSANVDVDSLEDWIVDFANKTAIKYCKTYGKDFINTAIERQDIAMRKSYRQNLQIIYYGRKHSILECREKAFKDRVCILRGNIRTHFNQYKSIFVSYQDTIIKLSETLRASMNISSDLCQPTKTSNKYKLEDFKLDTSEDFINNKARTLASELFSNIELMKVLYKFKCIFLELFTTHVGYNRTISICDYLKLLRDKSVRMVPTPNQTEIRSIVNKSVEDSMSIKIDIIY